MKPCMLLLYLSALVLIVPGCWSKYELTERGFVMGVALDQGENGKIALTTQIYRPTPAKGGSGPSTEASNINIKTTGASVMEAVRDIPIQLGRKAQWSHMRVVVVGEKLARKAEIGKLLDFFYRDHEPRHSVSLIIAKGSAAKLLEKQPLVEQTTGQQLLRAKESAYNDTGKTLDTTLLDLVVQMKSAHSDAAVSYVYENKKDKQTFNAAGLALFKKGKMTGVLPAKQVEGLLMLRNEYNAGVVEVACPGRKGESESLEILVLQTKIKPRLRGDEATVQVRARADVAIGELKCTSVETRADEAELVRKIEENMQSQMAGAIRELQTKKTDVIGIGNRIYSMNPAKWKKIKKNWDNQFAEIRFDIRVKVRIVTSGTAIGKPVLSEAP